MTDSDILRETLDELLRSGTTSNPALNSLLDDYTTYHLVLVAVGSLFLLGFVVLTARSWRGFRRAPRARHRRWTFEQRAYLSFAALGGVLGALMTVLIAANLSSVLDARRGVAGSLGMIGASRPGTAPAGLHHAFTTWLQSDSSATPPLVQQAIDDRLAWQRPKAAICILLLVVSVWLCVRIWRSLIVTSRVGDTGRNLTTVGRRLGRWSLVTACFLLMLMVLGNTQASIAPLGLTLFAG